MDKPASNSLLDKSLDALIAEKETKSKGVRVKPTSAFAKKKVTAKMGAGRESGAAKEGGSSRGGQQPQGKSSLAVARGKIAKPTGRRDGGNNGGGVIMAMPDENGSLVPVMMVPVGRMGMPMRGGRMGDRMGGMGGGGMGMGGDDDLPPARMHARKDPDADGKWTHDLFDKREQGGAARPAAASAAARRSGPGIFGGGGVPLRMETGTRVRVTNIHPNVNEQDLEELFSSIGQIISAEMDYNGNTRAGSATVVYKFAEDAKAAIKEYHGASLDGQKLSLSLAGSSSVAQLSSGITVTRDADGDARGDARGARGDTRGDARGDAGGYGGMVGGRDGGGSRSGGGRMFASALPSSSRGMGSDRLPRGMGDDMGAARPSRPAARGRMRSSAVASSGHDDRASGHDDRMMD
ncbi:hypothetical protein FOA52_010274 [Chlamydomonas sp. UWO 241]|nr:hypothetical protein FOA52_010274 [Chlamydomonas sp. UWO 241]